MYGIVEPTFYDAPRTTTSAGASARNSDRADQLRRGDHEHPPHENFYTKGAAIKPEKDLQDDLFTEAEQDELFREFVLQSGKTNNSTDAETTTSQMKMSNHGEEHRRPGFFSSGKNNIDGRAREEVLDDECSIPGSEEETREQLHEQQLQLSLVMRHQETALTTLLHWVRALSREGSKCSFDRAGGGSPGGLLVVSEANSAGEGEETTSLLPQRLVQVLLKDVETVLRAAGVGAAGYLTTPIKIISPSLKTTDIIGYDKAENYVLAERSQLILLGNAFSYPVWTKCLTKGGDEVGKVTSASSHDDSGIGQEEEDILLDSVGIFANHATRHEEERHEEDQQTNRNPFLPPRERRMGRSTTSTLFRDVCELIGKRLEENFRSSSCSDHRENLDHPHDSGLHSPHNFRDISLHDALTVFRFGWALFPQNLGLLDCLLKRIEEHEHDKELVWRGNKLRKNEGARASATHPEPHAATEDGSRTNAAASISGEEQCSSFASSYEVDDLVNAIDTRIAVSASRWLLNLDFGEREEHEAEDRYCDEHQMDRDDGGSEEKVDRGSAPAGQHAGVLNTEKEEHEQGTLRPNQSCDGAPALQQKGELQLTSQGLRERLYRLVAARFTTASNYKRDLPKHQNWSSSTCGKGINDIFAEEQTMLSKGGSAATALEDAVNQPERNHATEELMQPNFSSFRACAAPSETRGHHLTPETKPHTEEELLSANSQYRKGDEFDVFQEQEQSDNNQDKDLKKAEMAAAHRAVALLPVMQAILASSSRPSGYSPAGTAESRSRSLKLPLENTMEPSASQKKPCSPSSSTSTSSSAANCISNRLQKANLRPEQIYETILKPIFAAEFLCFLDDKDDHAASAAGSASKMNGATVSRGGKSSTEFFLFLRCAILFSSSSTSSHGSSSSPCQHIDERINLPTAMRQLASELIRRRARYNLLSCYNLKRYNRIRKSVMQECMF